MRARELALPLTGCSTCQSGPCTLTGQQNGAGFGGMGMKTGKLNLPPADGGIGWSSWRGARELTLVVRMWKSWLEDQFSYHPGRGSGL